MDILMSEFLPRKVKHITSSLNSSVFLWTSKLPLFSVRKIPKQDLVSNYKCDILQVGLKALAIHHHHSEEKLSPTRVVHCYTIPPTSKQYSARPLPPPPPSMWLSSSYAFKCTMIGDVLGAESGDCMMMMTSEVVDQVEQVIVKAEPPEEPSMVQSKSMMMRDKEKEKMNKEFPPPITLLRTHMGRMPWAFKRECGDDKRLIIRAERVTRHEHVEARRVNGRLTMNLVPEEDDDGEGGDDVEYCDECGYPMTEENVEEEEAEFDDLEFNEEPDEGLECEDEEQEEEEEEEEGGFEFEFEVEGSSLEKEGKLCWDLSECVAYGGEGGGLVLDSGSLWAGGNLLGDPNGYMGRPATASAPLRPITSVT